MGNIEIGKEYTGVVTGLTDFGAFVDIGGIDGLVHLTELSWSKIKHPSEVLAVGDTIRSGSTALTGRKIGYLSATGERKITLEQCR